MPTPPNKAQVERLVDHFAAITRSHVQQRITDEVKENPDFVARVIRDQAIDEVVAGIATFAAMSVSKVPDRKVERLDDFNAQFRAQLAAEIVSGFQPFTL